MRAGGNVPRAPDGFWAAATTFEVVRRCARATGAAVASTLRVWASACILVMKTDGMLQRRETAHLL